MYGMKLPVSPQVLIRLWAEVVAYSVYPEPLLTLDQSRHSRNFTEYGNILLLRNVFPTLPIVALTVTASARTQRKIILTLQLMDPFISVCQCVRDNLKLSLISKTSNEKATALMRFLINMNSWLICIVLASHHDDPGSIPGSGYCTSKVHPMGRDKDRYEISAKRTLAIHVRFVFHFSMPKSMESCYQECERGGRDGQLGYYVQQKLIYYPTVVIRQVAATFAAPTFISFIIKYIVNVFRSENKGSFIPAKITDRSMSGKDQGWISDNVYRLIQQIVLDNVLEEELVCAEGRQAYAKIHLEKYWPLQKYPFFMLQKEPTVQSKSDTSILSSVHP
ncbi:hypothetical protein DAPPUDRAFT_258939 [Daphnia pulex]|uniref:Uncharacterized protein n=1 Tax=Daphnia pulex TaxID=6669 RepID=E9HGA6_DAPPU|nr:hypothetical protein DAPPUDRAFT_258939 [Daphnia pulex]|eukprot:EFX69234.1 hypothetical protein DAPPUDRAFT_258939 [Daphnia pulex]